MKKVLILVAIIIMSIWAILPATGDGYFCDYWMINWLTNVPVNVCIPDEGVYWATTVEELNQYMNDPDHIETIRVSVFVKLEAWLGNTSPEIELITRIANDRLNPVMWDQVTIKPGIGWCSND